MMLEFSILPTEDTFPVQESTACLQPALPSKTHIPSCLQFLGLSIYLPVAPPDDTMCREEDRPVENAGNHTDTFKELTQDLDETMGVLQDKINELVRLDDELHEYSKHTNGRSTAECSMEIKRTRVKREFDDTQTLMSQTNDASKRDINCSALNKRNRLGSGDNSVMLGWETNHSSKLDSLLETSFQITDRIRKKAQTVSKVPNVSKDVRTHDGNRHSLTCSKIDFALKKRTNQTSRRMTNAPIRPPKERRNRTIANKTHSLPKSKSFAGVSSRPPKRDTGPSKVVRHRIESPISCCFKESESTFVSDFNGHPLENLFKDREKSSRKKSKKSNSIFRLLDCKKSLSTKEDTVPYHVTDTQNKALSAFISRRRSVHKDSLETQPMPFAITTPTTRPKNRSKSDSEIPVLEQSLATSSKHRLLHTLRIKKGLISASNLRSISMNNSVNSTWQYV